MKESTKSPRMYSLVVLYDMHTQFFKSVLDGISDEDAHNRLETKANHIAWLTGSLVEQRFEIAMQMGEQLQQTAHDLFRNNQGIKDGVTYPSLQTFRDDWDRITPVTRTLLINVSDEELDRSIDMGDMTMTVYELLSFTIYREANCIGQIALWRRLLGYDPMKYM